MTGAADFASGKGHRDENFPVASRLVCAELRPTILAFYRFARAADDVADHESASPERKLAELEQAAVGRWGEEARAALVWVVRDSARNRALVARYPEVFAARFPGSSRAWVKALAEGGPVPADPGLVWCDLRRGRLYAWRREVRQAADGLRPSTRSLEHSGGRDEIRHRPSSVR